MAFSHTSQVARLEVLAYTGRLVPGFLAGGSHYVKLRFQGQDYARTFLLATMKILIMGVDFLRHNKLLVDPAKGRHLDEMSHLKQPG